jgi:cytochrome c oxidase subunit IV
VSDRDDRRGIDRAAVVWGLLFTVVGLTYLLQELGVWDVRGEVLLPVLLIVAGGAVLATGVAGDRSSDRT